MLNLFTIKDNKVGVTFGDAIGLAFGAFFATIAAQMGALFISSRLINREIKDLDNQVDAIKGTTKMRHPFIGRVLIKQYGRSWEKLLTMQLKREIKFYFENVLKYSLEIQKGMSESTANKKFSTSLALAAVKQCETNANIPLSSSYWRYLLNDMGFTWLWSPWNGYDKTSDGKVVALKSTLQAKDEYKEYLKRIEIKAFNTNNLYEIEQTWFFDNHKSMIDVVLKELFNEHPEYKKVCPINI